MDKGASANADRAVASAALLNAAQPATTGPSAEYLRGIEDAAKVAVALWTGAEEPAMIAAGYKVATAIRALAQESSQ